MLEDRVSFPLQKPIVLGILNLTPDSFSDGGRYVSVPDAIAQAQHLLASGADWLDLGAESTRPGAEPVSADEEWQRLAPVIAALADKAVLSVDTMKAEVAERALRAGALIINDVGGGRDPDMLKTVARHGAGYIAMHMRGEPKTMQQALIPYEDVVKNVGAFLLQCVTAAEAAGVKRVWVDPGLGFGKSVTDNWELVKALSEFASLGQGVVFAASRKRFISSIAGEDLRLKDEVSAQLAVWAVQQGAAIVRAHDAQRSMTAVQTGVTLGRQLPRNH